MWLTPKIISTLKIDGLSDDANRVRDYLKENACPSRPRLGRGGGLEYDISGLPADVSGAIKTIINHRNAMSSPGYVAARRAARAERQISEDDKEQRRQEGAASLMTKREQDLKRADILNDIVHAFKFFCVGKDDPLLTLKNKFIELFKNKEVKLPDNAYSIIKKISIRTLDRWILQFNHGGYISFAEKPGRKSGTRAVDLDPRFLTVIEGLMHDQPDVRPSHVHEVIVKYCGDDIASIPSLRTVQRWVARWKQDHKQLHALLVSPDGWRSKYKAASGRADQHIKAPNQRWELDSTKTDIVLIDGVRHCIVACIDVYTRRVKFWVSRTSSAAAVCALMRACILDWGVPQQIGTDNGADYVSERVIRLAQNLDLDHDIAPPYTPEHKPFIERMFGTLNRDLFELMPEYVGHNVAEAQRIRSRKSFAELMTRKHAGHVKGSMTPEQLQDWLNSWAEDRYHHRKHGGFRGALKGKTPFEVYAEWQGEIRKIWSHRVLDVVLMPPPSGENTRTVSKKGVRVDTGLYHAPELGAMEGERVEVRIDETDLGKIWLFDLKGDFVCIAVDEERLGITLVEVAKRRTRMQREIMSDEKARTRAARRDLTTSNMVRDIIDDDRTASASLVAFPKPQTPQETPALTSAGEALKQLSAPAPAVSSKVMARAAEIIQMPRETQAQKEAREADERWARWISINDQVLTGADVGPENRNFWARYQQSAAFKSRSRRAQMINDGHLTAL